MAGSGEDEPTLSSDYTAWASRRSRARAARARSLDEEHRHIVCGFHPQESIIS